MIDYDKDSELLKVLGHPVRLRMVEGLMNGECNVSKIVSILKLPQSTVSQHLSLLKVQGIIEPRKEGVRTCYRVVNDRVCEIVKLLGK